MYKLNYAASIPKLHTPALALGMMQRSGEIEHQRKQCFKSTSSLLTPIPGVVAPFKGYHSLTQDWAGQTDF
ncbi:hypothetical protein XELAEV_18027170mg [Xenopus laevis]|uniref:Uncharacterized protein n=1 Tax=Xenopus laevis TaxID=8355 RepID=A0A974CWZ7_XENLA|nr:hypothetical protein XELAEV_18027170mg [Xenopus laevis]